MSVLYCEFCDNYVDTDFDSEHYTLNGKCYEELMAELKDEGLSEEEIEERIELEID